MLIIADENIPLVREAMAQLGEVRLVSGRTLGARDLAQADVLLIRSVTPVNHTLLHDTPVRFIGTATIGTDHIDLAYLRDRGIGFASAAGSNARSVVEYVVAAMLEIAVRHGFELDGLTLGIVGRGHIGSLLAETAPALGLRVLVNDPPLQRAGHPGPFVPLPQILEQSDFISLHVPLLREGPDCTVHLIGSDQLRATKPGAILLNTSRGSVVDNQALLESLQSGRLAGAVLDVWEGEPAIDSQLLRRVELATPHIAGYSLDGKVNGTTMLARAVREFLRIPGEWKPHLSSPDEPTCKTGRTATIETFLREAVTHCYPIAEDDERLRRGLQLPKDQRPGWFDLLRKEYPVRREFGNFHLEPGSAPPAWAERAGMLGFRVDEVKVGS